MAGRRIGGSPDVYEVSEIKEKPLQEYAEEHLRTPGLPRGQYLCFFGLHVLPPSIFDAIGYHIKNDIRERSEIQPARNSASAKAVPSVSPCLTMSR